MAAALAQLLMEAVETIPEAVMQTMGFDGAPVLVIVAYWLVLAAALFFAFKRK
jgi:spore maturation protein SpmB